MRLFSAWNAGNGCVWVNGYLFRSCSLFILFFSTITWRRRYTHLNNLTSREKCRKNLWQNSYASLAYLYSVPMFFPTWMMSIQRTIAQRAETEWKITDNFYSDFILLAFCLHFFVFAAANNSATNFMRTATFYFCQFVILSSVFFSSSLQTSFCFVLWKLSENGAFSSIRNDCLRLRKSASVDSWAKHFHEIRSNAPDPAEVCRFIAAPKNMNEQRNCRKNNAHASR